MDMSPMDLKNFWDTKLYYVLTLLWGWHVSALPPVGLFDSLKWHSSCDLKQHLNINDFASEERLKLGLASCAFDSANMKRGIEKFNIFWRCIFPLQSQNFEKSKPIRILKLSFFFHKIKIFFECWKKNRKIKW